LAARALFFGVESWRKIFRQFGSIENTDSGQSVASRVQMVKVIWTCLVMRLRSKQAKKAVNRNSEAGVRFQIRPMSA
jgi:hypothetical protein